MVGRRHWEERNRLQWSRERLAALLAPLPVTNLDAALGTASIVQLKNMTGEVVRAQLALLGLRLAARCALWPIIIVRVQAYQTMRKGNKKFAVFDLHVTLSWEGRWHDGDILVRCAHQHVLILGQSASSAQHHQEWFRPLTSILLMAGERGRTCEGILLRE